MSSETHSGSSSSAADGPAPAGGGVSVGPLGMWLFLASLAVLFAASMAAYLVIRSRADAWPPPDMPPLPTGLWVATAILLISGLTVHWAVRAARRDDQGTLIGAMLVTTLLGVVFLAVQIMNWGWLIWIQRASFDSGLYMGSFFLLTGLHALHVVGGLIYLAMVTARCFHGRYSSAYYPGVRYSAMYWHFLDAVWIVMFVLVFLI
jgi:cytochrome c oxidase subunit 3